MDPMSTAVERAIATRFESAISGARGDKAFMMEAIAEMNRQSEEKLQASIDDARRRMEELRARSNIPEVLAAVEEFLRQLDALESDD